ncbi:hypothetical protein CWI38_0311p0030 [Hamiltosporidium tvaerminnensis]|uniref:Uncharacterized protein n=2 Tax=Hamiltosporidium TaxID=1176354 RepID=A0A4Q9LV17_9MICR|nr:hypothetical protein CWI39_0690p0020 [Hamiltosporidium magnivora]TBU12508.1 hypothetical protein CWI38_0728p0030 [Hamiltosporidium tvaerminnensis]TBU15522.1 hypothetical protein CWI38_0311p0030 [Hamiltosporidium tvaerminnensis]
MEEGDFEVTFNMSTKNAKLIQEVLDLNPGFDTMIDSQYEVMDDSLFEQFRRAIDCFLLRFKISNDTLVLEHDGPSDTVSSKNDKKGRD